jgi:hypothetical protein
MGKGGAGFEGLIFILTTNQERGRAFKNEQNSREN